VENLADALMEKTEAIITYYKSFVEDDITMSTSKYLNEISLFTMFALIEVKLFQEFIRPKENFFEDEELHLLKLTKSGHDYCYCNLGKSNISINKENPMLENYAKSLKSLELNLLDIVKKIIKKLGFDPDEISTLDYLSNSLKLNSHAHMETYFFTIFEKALLHFSKHEQAALNEFIISKYHYETILWLRIILTQKLETTNFSELFECIENDDEINLFSDIKKKNKNWQVNFDNVIIFSFLGGVIKGFKINKVIESEITSDTIVANAERSVDELIKFYTNIIKMVLECSKEINNIKS
jgi:hypothetical protein